MAQSKLSILCLIGLPASGKTSLALFIKKHKLGFSRVITFCFDNLITWSSDEVTWKEERKNVFLKVENEILLLLKEKSFNENCLIILDDNMYYRSMRYTFYQLSKCYKIKFCQVYLSTPLVTCLQRNSRRPQPVPIKDILNINEKLETPFYLKHWERNTLTLNGEENFEKYSNELKTFIESAVVSGNLIEEVKLNDTFNSKHISDIALRRIISLMAKRMKATNENNMVAKIMDLNKKKNEVLNLINNNKIDLPSSHDIKIFMEYLSPFLVEHQQEKGNKIS